MLSTALQAMEDFEEKKSPLHEKKYVTGVAGVDVSVAEGERSCCCSSPERQQHIAECVGGKTSVITPKKQQRGANLVAAKSMDEARLKSKGVRRG